MNAVVSVVNEAQPSESLALMQVIERAAANPQVDIDKLERLLAMRERMHAQEAERAFNVALNAAQSETGRISADAQNPQTRSMYASYAKLDKVLRPIYTKHGFSLSFDESDSPKPEHVRVLCHVSHSAGHTRTYHKDMPADGKGAKGGDVMTKTHASGAAQSYGMRYLLKGIFNVAVGEEDRDGNGDVTCVSEEQAAHIEKLLADDGLNRQQFLDYAKIQQISEIRAENFDTVVRFITAAAARKRART